MKSILFVPADRPKLFEKAASGDASIICLDLEDGVAPSAKPEARQNIKEAIGVLSSVGKSIALRINSDLEHISLDIQALTSEISMLVVPKAGSALLLGEVSDAVQRSHHRVIDLLPLVESSSDLIGLEQASALPSNVVGLALGTEDFAADLSTTAWSEPIQSAFLRLAILAAHHQVALFGYPGSIAEFKDLGRFGAWVEKAKASGSVGGFAIHPAQVGVLNETFALSDAELDLAREIVELFEQALSDGRGAISHNGGMIDRPVYLAAKRKLS